MGAKKQRSPVHFQLRELEGPLGNAREGKQKIMDTLTRCMSLGPRSGSRCPQSGTVGLSSSRLSILWIGGNILLL